MRAVLRAFKRNRSKQARNENLWQNSQIKNKRKWILSPILGILLSKLCSLDYELGLRAGRFLALGKVVCQYTWRSQVLLCVLPDFNFFSVLGVHCSGKRKTSNKTMVVMHLLCTDTPGLHHPGSQLFGAPLEEIVCLHLQISVKTT